MGYAEDDLLAQNDAFQKRVRQATINVALAVSSEPETNRNVVDNKRNTLAKSVLNDANSYMVRFTNAVIQVGAGNMTETSPDSDITNAVSAAWNGMAGVTQADK